MCVFLQQQLQLTLPKRTSQLPAVAISWLLQHILPITLSSQRGGPWRQPPVMALQPSACSSRHWPTSLLMRRRTLPGQG